MMGQGYHQMKGSSTLILGDYYSTVDLASSIVHELLLKLHGS